MSNVSNIVKTIQDIMRKDAGTYGDAQRLERPRFRAHCGAAPEVVATARSRSIRNASSRPS